MSQSEDMAAIDSYIRNTHAVSDPAAKLQRQWGSWYEGLGWFDRNANSSIYNEARARRKAFNDANKTPEDPGGLTTEMMQMDPSNPQTQAVISQQRTTNIAKAASLKYGHDTIKQGSRGPAVVEWQRIIGGIAADGNFGPKTHELTKKWQVAHNLTADGVVGPKSWAKAAEPPPAPPVAAPSPSPAPATPSAPTAPRPAPRPTASAPRPTSTAKPKPAVSGPQKKAGPLLATAKKTGESIKVAEAGIVSSVKALPLWQKIVLGAIAIGSALLFGSKSMEDYKKKHGEV